MTEVKKILLLADGSENSQRAEEYAVYFSGLTGAAVDILHVVNMGTEFAALNPVAGGYIPEQVTEELKAAGKELLEAAAAKFPANSEVHTHLGFGTPTEVTMSFCDENHPDLLIMGSRGMGTFKGLVLGSVSGYLVSHAPCPILVIK